jgi:hypothetical protein
MKILRIAVAAALAAATAVAGLATFAAPASADVPASNPIQYVTDYFWGDTGTYAVMGTVSCPSGSRVVSSGASANGGGAAGLGGQLTAIAPDINSFTSASATAKVAGYLQITVGCEAAAAMSEVTTRTIQLPYGSGFRRGVVYCPAGMHAFGGGGYMVKPFGIGGFSRDSAQMVSNTVTADGTGWTYAATTSSANDAPVITTQCAPLRGSYVSQTGTPDPYFQHVNTYGPCPPGYTALSGGVYLSKPNGSEDQNGYLDYSIPASGNRWYVRGISFGNPGSKLVALEQCIR